MESAEEKDFRYFLEGVGVSREWMEEVCPKE